MTQNKVTRKELNYAIQKLVEVLDNQKAGALETLLKLEGESIDLENGDKIIFRKGRNHYEHQNEEDPFPRRLAIIYNASGHKHPILKLDVIVAGIRQESSKISFLCSTPHVYGYSIQDDIDHNAVLQYRFFNNLGNGFLRSQLLELSGRLTA